VGDNVIRGGRPVGHESVDCSHSPSSSSSLGKQQQQQQQQRNYVRTFAIKMLETFQFNQQNSIVSFQYRIVVREDDLRIVAFAREFMAVNISTSTFLANRGLSFVQVWHHDYSIEENNDE
jgi:hypothetical protein